MFITLFPTPACHNVVKQNKGIPPDWWWQLDMITHINHFLAMFCHLIGINLVWLESQNQYNLYTVPMINISKYQKDWSNRSQVVMNKNTVLTNGKATYYQNLSVIKKYKHYNNQKPVLY